MHARNGNETPGQRQHTGPFGWTDQPQKHNDARCLWVQVPGVLRGEIGQPQWQEKGWRVRRPHLPNPEVLGGATFSKAMALEALDPAWSGQDHDLTKSVSKASSSATVTLLRLWELSPVREGTDGAKIHEERSPNSSRLKYLEHRFGGTPTTVDPSGSHLRAGSQRMSWITECGQARKHLKF